MKIAVTTDAFYPRTHGIAVAIDSSIRYLAEEGHEVALFAPSFPDTKEREYPEGIIIHRFNSYRIYDLGLTTNKEERFVYRNEFKRICALLDEFEPDVLYNHMEFTVGSVARKWAKENSVPSVMMVHTYFPPYFKIYAPFLPLRFWKTLIKYWSQYFYKDFDLLVTPSKEMKEVMQDIYKIQKQPIEILPTGIIQENFIGVDRKHEQENSFLYEQHPRIKNRHRLLFVGRIGKEKNVQFLLDMMVELCKKRDDVELLLAGSGSYMDQYIQLVDKMGIAEHVTFLGAFPNSQMKYIYAVADVFVFASLTETQGVVTTEALCNGIPVVAIAALGSISVLEDERGGFLVPINDVRMFIEKIHLLLDNKEVYLQKEAEAIERGKELAFDRLTGPLMLELLSRVANNHYKEVELSSTESPTPIYDDECFNELKEI